MQNVQIYINNSLVDFKVDEPINLQFRKLLDDWLDFGGTLSTTANTLANSLNIPATTRNTEILQNSNNANSLNFLAHGVKAEIAIYIHSYPVFIGTGFLDNVEYQDGIAVAYNLSIQPRAIEVFLAMEKLLTEIYMGVIGSTVADIDAANSPPISNTDSPVVWPLLNYGGRTVDNRNMDFSLWNNANSLRPAVRLWKIIEAFFLEQGYTVVGELYQNLQFRNEVYYFGVGEDWKRGDNYPDYYCSARVGTNPIYQIIPNNSIVLFPDDTTPPHANPVGLNVDFFDASASVTLGITKSGWYEFEILIDSADSIVYDVIVTNSTDTSPVIVYSAQRKGIMLRTEPIVFHLPDVGQLEGDRTQLKIRVYRTSGTGDITLGENSYYKAQMIDRAQMGAPINISSCLHPLKFKDFMRGVMRKFGAVLLIDNVLKIARLETRFVNDLGETLPNYIQNFTKSYYLVDEQPVPLDIDTEVSNITNEKPFGDNIGLYFPKDDEDGAVKIYERTADPAVINTDVPLYSTSIELASIGKERKDYEDTFFSPALNSRFNISPTDIYNNALYYPVVIDNQDLLEYDNIGAVTGKFPTYKSAPKSGTWYGILDMTGKDAGTNYFNLVTYENGTGGGLPSGLTYLIPSSFQIFPDHPTYFELIPNPINSVFPTYYYTNANAGAGGYIYGLVDVYHRKYLSIVFNDKIVRLRARLRITDFQNENFRKPRLINLQGQVVKAWIIEINNYNPIDSDLADYTLIVDSQDIGDFGFGLTNNNYRPLILMWSDLKAVEDGNY